MQTRESTAAAQVDTVLILRPDSIVLRVGASVQLDTIVRTEGHGKDGLVLRSFMEWQDIQDLSIAQVRDAGLTGLKAGRKLLVVIPFSTDTAIHTHAPPSCIVLHVLP